MLCLNSVGLEGPSLLHLQPDCGLKGQCLGLFGRVRMLLGICLASPWGDGPSILRLFSLVRFIFDFDGLILNPSCKYVKLMCLLLEAYFGSGTQNVDWPKCF